MTPLEIKIEMMKKGVSQRGIARKLNVSQPVIHLIINRKGTSARVMKEVADSIGRDVKYVFPERFFKEAI